MEDRNTTEQNQHGGVGRTNFIAGDTHTDVRKQDQPVSRDISDIDRQEGSMHNGVKGAGLDRDDNTEANDGTR